MVPNVFPIKAATKVPPEEQPTQTPGQPLPDRIGKYYVRTRGGSYVSEDGTKKERWKTHRFRSLNAAVDFAKARFRDSKSPFDQPILYISDVKGYDKHQAFIVIGNGMKRLDLPGISKPGKDLLRVEELDVPIEEIP